MRARPAWAALLLIVAAPDATAAAAESPGLHAALERLAREGKFSGAVVIRGADGVRFASGYGLADPFEGRAFTPDTPADSGSLAKPVTAAAVLLLARDGRIALDAPVRRYLPDFPHAATTVRHLLSHSAGLAFDESAEALADKDNAALLAATGAPLFPQGQAFDYCNLCSVALAMLIERVSGADYLRFVRDHAMLPPGVTLRPPRLADWRGRAIGYRRGADGAVTRFDSWEGERFYGPANLSVTAAQLAEWGSQWWRPPLARARAAATVAARIGGNASGLTLGNWYCAPGGRRCHYVGHHEGFHHLLYWDADRRLSVAMLSNNALAPGLQQPLQRALVAFAEGRPDAGRREFDAPLAGTEAPPGRFRLGSGEIVAIAGRDGRISVRRGGIDYPAYPVGPGIRYAPGLDAYFAGAPRGRLRWLSLYEALDGRPVTRASVRAPRR